MYIKIKIIICALYDYKSKLSIMLYRKVILFLLLLAGWPRQASKGHRWVQWHSLAA